MLCRIRSETKTATSRLDVFCFEQWLASAVWLSYFLFVSRLAFAGVGLSDDEFLDLIRKKDSDQKNDGDDLDNYDQQRIERQEERIKTLQATVDAQTELLKAIADKLQIKK